MSFFEEQDRARRNTVRLVVLYVAALGAIVATTNFFVVPLHVIFTGTPGWFEALVLVRPLHLYQIAPVSAYLGVTAITLTVIAAGTIEIMAHLSEDEAALARMLEGRMLGSSPPGTPERRLSNVVEEMSIASGLATPRIFVLHREESINAFAAGRSHNQAFIVVTQGALEQLSRDELQGVIAHEFSHILNGDLLLNLRMVFALQGIVFLSAIGRFMMRYYSGWGTEEGRRFVHLPFAIIGAGVFAIGAVGLVFARLIQAAVAREREYLADACAVQYTRNADGLCGALAKIQSHPAGSRLMNWHADALGHMLFAPGVKQWFAALLATHPPIGERVRRANPHASLDLYLARMRHSAAAVKAGRGAAGDEVLPMASAPVPIAPRRLTDVTALIATIGEPTPEHLEFAGGLLAYLPPSVREALATPEGAQAVMLGFLIVAEDTSRTRALDAFAAMGLETLGRHAEVLSPVLAGLDRAYRLPIIAIALPVLRQLDASGRERFLRALRSAIESDLRLTLDEFVLQTILDWNLGPRAKLAGKVKYGSHRELAGEARLVLSLLAHAGTVPSGDPAASFSKGAAALGDASLSLVSAGELRLGNVTTALESLALLAPLEKPPFLAACCAVINADRNVRLVEFELVRAVAAAMDCPMPPSLAAADPRLLKR